MTLSSRSVFKIPYLETGLIVLLACVPLFLSFPYRINIFLSWEGAYRMSLGQVPFWDFGTPLGGFYWVVPAFFFKLFGPEMISLIKAQVLINILSGLAFRSILKSLEVRQEIRFLAVLTYCLSFSFFNFWPWYNHSVIVYEFMSIAFLLRGINAGNNRISWLNLFLAGLLTCCSFFTKQDAGGLTILFCLVLSGYVAIIERKPYKPLIYLASLAITFTLFLLIVGGPGFTYWFNHGQAPHSARISLFDLADEFLSASQWIKFYLFMIVFLLLFRIQDWKHFLRNRNEMLFLLVTVGVLLEAAVFQVTSYTPPDNNIFYHSFGLAYVLASLSMLPGLRLQKPWMLGIISLALLLWWSSVLWKYVQPSVARKFAPAEAWVSPTGENVVNRKTYKTKPREVKPSDNSRDAWITLNDVRGFHKISMPPSTAEGIRRLLKTEIKGRNGLAPRILNMSELTPLAAAMPFNLETSPQYPLWFHLGVGMFNKQADMLEQRMRDRYYDLIIFEYIPTLNNFYPFRTHDQLTANYVMVDEFAAPRRGEALSRIQVFRPK